MRQWWACGRQLGLWLQAVWGAVETYLELADGPNRQQQELEREEARLAAMSVDDQKKERLRKKKVRLCCLAATMSVWVMMPWW